MLTLNSITVGQTVRIVNFHQIVGGFRQQLLAMGLTPGAAITVTQIAPLGDPFQIQLRGYNLSLRKKECQQIEVEYVTENNHPSKRVLSCNSAAGNCGCR